MKALNDVCDMLVACVTVLESVLCLSLVGVFFFDLRLRGEPCLGVGALDSEGIEEFSLLPRVVVVF